MKCPYNGFEECFVEECPFGFGRDKDILQDIPDPTLCPLVHIDNIEESK